MTGRETNECRAIVITGPIGAGKSSTANALVDVLAQRNIPNAGIDMDFLRRFHPIPADDPFGAKMGRINLAAVAANYRANGITTLVLADVITGESDSIALQQALDGYLIHMVRLQVSLEALEQRLRIREPEETIAWYLERAPQLQDIMTTNGVGDIVIEVDEENPEQVAEMIAAKLELL